MKYYYSFDLNRLKEIQSVIYDKYKDKLHTDNPSAFIVEWSPANFPILHEELTKVIKLPIGRARFFITPPHRSLDVHADGNVIKENIFAINIPIHCADNNHYQLWYEYDGEIKVSRNQKYAQFLLPGDTSRLREADRLTVTKPAMVQIGKFHGVENHTDQHRVILSLRFYKTLIGQQINSIDEVMDL